MEKQKQYATLDCFRKVIPCAITDLETAHFGTVRVRRFSRSVASKLDAWLRPNGKASTARKKLRNLKIVTLSVVDGDGNLVFNFDDDEAGTKKLAAFAKEIEESEATPWDEFIYEVMVVQGYFKKEEDLLGKSDS